MRSHITDNNQKNSDESDNNQVAYSSEKIRFGMKLYPETLDMVDAAYRKDCCTSRSAFIEKAIRFYCGYLNTQDHTAIEYSAPQLATIIDGYIKGSEQHLSRAIFKLAVEVGAQTHILAR